MSEMPVVSFDPWAITGEISPGDTVLDAGEYAGADIEALCGGNGVCGTCAVRIDEGMDELAPPTDAEKKVLSDEQRENGYRLSCQASVSGDVSVHVPPSSRSQGAIIMTEGRELEYDLDPSVQLHHVSMSAPTLEDHLPDRERVINALEDQYDKLDIGAVDYRTMQELPERLRAGQSGDTIEVGCAVFEESEIITVRPGRFGDGYGIAVDVGTTTVAVYLVDLRTGEIVDVSSDLNPQRAHGEDIISRVQLTSEQDDGSAILQEKIIEGINGHIAELLRGTDIVSDDILDAVFVGNTAMHHLFLGIDPSPVARTPYVPGNQASLGVKAREINLHINQSAYVTWFPIIGGWVGADFVADLLAGDILQREATTLCIDIGTNGEMAVFDGEQAWVASAPAGPALEGAEITRGVRAKPGAIEAVTLDPETWEAEVEVIGEEKPLGICGSGILDIVAELFRVGAINRRGRLLDPRDGRGRIRESDAGEREFVLLETKEVDIGNDIVVSQDDIRAIQNAKAAIQTGANILLKEAGVTDVEHLVMAGGFGNFIDPESAKLLGMYPDVDVDHVEFLGNAAGHGAVYGLMNEDSRREAEAIVEELIYIELAAWDGFHDEFMRSMYLPHRDFDLYPGVRASIESVRELHDERL